MFISERRIKKSRIRSRILGHLIVDRVSRKPQKSGPGKSPIAGSRFTVCTNRWRHSPYHACSGKCENGRLPRTTQGNVFTQRPARLRQ